MILDYFKWFLDDFRWFVDEFGWVWNLKFYVFFDILFCLMLCIYGLTFMMMCYSSIVEAIHQQKKGRDSRPCLFERPEKMSWPGANPPAVFYHSCNLCTKTWLQMSPWMRQKMSSAPGSSFHKLSTANFWNLTWRIGSPTKPPFGSLFSAEFFFMWYLDANLHPENRGCGVSQVTLKPRIYIPQAPCMVDLPTFSPKNGPVR